jgi:hypothetical protein
MIMINNSNVIIKATKFDRVICNSCQGGIFNLFNTNLDIYNSSFTNIIAFSAGVIFISNLNNNISLNNCNFI